MFQLDLKSRKPINDQIIDNIKRLIHSGSLRQGEKLPSVRDLSRILTVNPNTIQKAYRQLENSGHVYSIVGLGTFVADIGDLAPDAERINEIKRRLKSEITELHYLGLSSAEIGVLLDQVQDERGNGS